MKTIKVLVMAGLLAVMPLGVATVSAAAPEIQLTAAGNALEQKYAGQLQAAQAEIGRAVPGIDESMKVALAKACEATKAAKAGVNAAQQSLGKIAGAAGLVTSAVAWLWRDRSAVARLWRDTPAMKRSTSLIALSMERQGDFKGKAEILKAES